MVTVEKIDLPEIRIIGRQGLCTREHNRAQELWAEANAHFAEVAPLGMKEPDGSFTGFWGAMSDEDMRFQPWTEGFTRGMYLAGIEVAQDKEAPEGWTKWVLPARTYLVCDVEAPRYAEIFDEVIEKVIPEMGLALDGAVCDYTKPSTGQNRLFFPVREKENTKKVDEPRKLRHAGTPVLETERLILRPYRAEDAEAMFRNWASSETVTRYLTWPPHRDAAITAQLIGLWVSEYETPANYHWGIELKEAGEVIGDLAVVQMDERALIGELGWCLGEKWWGRGIMPEAGQAVLKYLFETVGFNRIEARHDAVNTKSGRVMQKLGMQYEGINRQAGWNNQGICDIARYAILLQEWMKR